ncbi:hypothetical protein RU98_GL002204 [Enterococcus caccae]|nr:hypothetical protein RU98_GL002204 [Enterococcus caccae]
MINRVSYKNFKGFKNFTLDLNGKPAVVSARNGFGKTSLSDGLQWLFFGKDTQGSKLNPKPLDANNNEQIGLEPEVEAELIIDGKTVTLKRIQKESWSSKRGEVEKTRGSDTTKYFIDTVPTKEKDWKAYLEEIGGESKLQMLSNASFFMQMNWKERRSILISMSGLTDEDVIQNDPELAELATILDGHSVDEMKKILAGQKKEVKANIEGIPARIQENTDAINNIKNDKTPEKVQEAIAFFSKEIEDKEKKLSSFVAGDPTLDHRQELSQLQIKLAEANNQFLTSSNLATQSLQEDVNAQQAKVNNIRAAKQELESNEYRLQRAIQEKNEFRAAKLAEYKALNEKTFDDHQTTCPTCNQDLPLDQVEELRNKFNKDKAEKIEENKAAVEAQKATKQDMASLDKELQQVRTEINRLTGEFSAANQQLDLINNDLNFQRTKIGSFEQSDQYREINQQINQCQQKIKDATGDKGGEEQALLQAIAEDKNNLAVMQATLKEFDLIKQFEDRINELKNKDQELKQQNQDIERKLWMIDEFTRRKVKKLEESINDKFEMVKFKLFNILKNGAIDEVCEATYKGVEYSSGLNNGARINCDLDIINTLSREFGIHLPVFVDNAESVNQLIDVDTQMIELQVTEDEQLKVEV